MNGYEYDKNGIALGTWIQSLRRTYAGSNDCTLNFKQIELLEQIGMNWFSDKKNSELQQEEITHKNINKKQKEILNRTISYLSAYDSETLPSKEEMNQRFIGQLNGIKNRCNCDNATIIIRKISKNFFY